MPNDTQGSSQTSSANSGAANTASSAAATTATNGPEYVTKAELEALQKSIQDSLQAQSGILGRISNDLDKKLKPKAQETKTEDATLTERIKAIETREAKQREVLKQNSLKSAAMAKGVPEKKASLYAKMILAEHDENVITTDNYDVLYRESESKQVPISDWVAANLQTDFGEVFLPIKAAASSDGQGGSGKGAAAVNPYLGMNFDQIMAAKDSDPAGWDAYMQAHPDDWAHKQKSWKPKR